MELKERLVLVEENLKKAEMLFQQLLGQKVLLEGMIKETEEKKE